ncbi:hypothetical protein ACA910_000898 [Epithemia clementina (nom. ined.)]
MGGTRWDSSTVNHHGTVPSSSSSSLSLSSTRGLSRKNRIYVFRDFLLKTYGDYLNPRDSSSDRSAINDNRRPKILDVAGGKGDLSWILNNLDGLDSVIVDPWSSSSDHILRSVRYLRNNPHVVAERSIPGLPTYQPLASVLHQIPSDLALIRTPTFIRIRVNDQLVAAVRGYQETQSLEDWNVYWHNSAMQQQANSSGTRDPAEDEENNNNNYERTRSEMANGETFLLDILFKSRLIVGFHPDQATEALMDLAMVLQVPLAVVPCCVFPSEFPNRTNPENGNRVRTYHEFMEYLKQRFPLVREAWLDFHFTETAKSRVLFTLPGDYDRNA